MARGVARLELPTWITFAPCRTITGYLRSLACAHIIMPKNPLRREWRQGRGSERSGERLIDSRGILGSGDSKAVLGQEIYSPFNLVTNPLATRLRLRPKLEVLDSVVMSDPIFVVNILIRSQLPTKVLLHDYAMLPLELPNAFPGFIDPRPGSFQISTVLAPFAPLARSIWVIRSIQGEVGSESPQVRPAVSRPAMLHLATRDLATMPLRFDLAHQVSVLPVASHSLLVTLAVDGPVPRVVANLDDTRGCLPPTPSVDYGGGQVRCFTVNFYSTAVSRAEAISSWDSVTGVNGTFLCHTVPNEQAPHGYSVRGLCAYRRLSRQACNAWGKASARISSMPSAIFSISYCG